MSNLKPNCMLCLDPCGQNENWNQTKRHIMALANYVQLFHKKDETSGEIPQLILCKTCRDNLKRFSDLLTALQIAEMKVDSCLKDIYDLMVKKGNTATKEAGTFRESLIEKTSSKLKRSNSQPILKIRKTRISRISTIPVTRTETPSEFTEESTFIKLEPKQEETHDFVDLENELDDSNGFDAEDDTDPIPTQQNESNEDNTKFLVERKVKCASGRWIKRLYCLHCKIRVKYREKHLQTFHKKVSGNVTTEQLKCTYCRAYFKEARITGIKKRRGSSHMGALKLRQHMLQYHCEHYFPNRRLESISLSDFQQIVLELLFQDLIEGRESCAFCPRPFKIPPKQKDKMRHWLRIKLHYVECHFEILEEKLKEIQEDPELQEKLRKCNPEGRLCDFCGIYLMNLCSQVGHRKFHCKFTEGPKLLETVHDGHGAMKKLPVSKTDVEGKVKCNLCATIITQEWAKHHVNNHFKASKQKEKAAESASKSDASRCNSDFNYPAMEIGFD